MPMSHSSRHACSSLGTTSFRAEVVHSALHANDEMRGEEPVYRSREWRSVERAEARSEKKGNWFKKSWKGASMRQLCLYMLQLAAS